METWIKLIDEIIWKEMVWSGKADYWINLDQIEIVKLLDEEIEDLFED
jgi:hypothetical protein